LRHGNYLKEREREREREGGREGERMDDYFCVAPNHKILAVKNGAKTLQV
jgi:hypothetical protein